MEFNSFDFIKELSYPRVSGSTKENKAALRIQDEATKLGIPTIITPFIVDYYNTLKTELIINGESFLAISIGNSKSTELDGITGELVYLSDLNDAKTKDINNKICLIPERSIDFNFYKYLINNNIKGIIFCDGNIYNKASILELEPFIFKERFYKYGNTVAICIHMSDMNKIIANKFKSASIISIVNSEARTSYNVIGQIKGEIYPEEYIVISAHYDSVASSIGAYDNLSGVVSLLKIGQYFLNNKPKRSIKLLWCGSEEAGLLGSKAFIKEIENDIHQYLFNFNIDMVGVTIGYNIIRVSADKRLVSYIDYYSKIIGYSIDVDLGIYKSDSEVFADNGIPSLTFSRIPHVKGAKIHSNKDIIDILDLDTLNSNIEYIIGLIDNIVNSKVFPINNEIPYEIKEELDIYNGRKTKK